MSCSNVNQPDILTYLVQGTNWISACSSTLAAVENHICLNDEIRDRGTL